MRACSGPCVAPALAAPSSSREPRAMPLVNMKDMLEHAYRHNYAVGSFDLAGLEFLQGVMGAAERCRAPVILSLRDAGSEPYDFDLLVCAVERAAERASIPAAIHMRHGTDADAALRAINRGCNGVMVDASDRPLGENIGVTAAVVAMAHGCGVPVEGGLGCVPGAKGDGVPPDLKEIAYTSVAEARGYVERTRVDFLSVSIGTVRGAAGTKRKLNWQRLKQLNEALGIPLTIYGGSGMNQSQYSRLIADGVAKIDCDGALADAAYQQLRTKAKVSASGSYAGPMRAVQEAVEQETERCLRLSGAAGRAAEVLEQCRHWGPVEHAVTHDVQGLSEGAVEGLLEEGRRLLSTIPGVREVCSGSVFRQDEILRCSWQVRFCHAAAVESYRTHSAYLAFADRPAHPSRRFEADSTLSSWGVAGLHPARPRPDRLSQFPRS